MTDSTPKPGTNLLKYVSLVTLTFQASILTLSMRYGRTRAEKEDLFFNSTVIVMAESVKLITCSVIVFFEEERSARKFGTALRKTIIENKIDTLKVCVPSLLYVIQNNLYYLSISNLNATIFLIACRLKILSTAIFAVIMLGKRLSLNQCMSFFILIAGIAIVELGNEEKASKLKQNRILGFCAVLVAGAISGFAGVFLEKLFKRDDVSVWMRNLQMSIIGIPLGIATCLTTDYDNVISKGFFHGYDWFVVYLVLLQTSSGLLVAMVIKYAGNILKGFATSFAIIVTSLASIYLFDYQATKTFVIGTLLVIGSVFLYSYVRKPKETETTEEQSDKPDRNENENYLENKNDAKDNKVLSSVYVIRL